jgi:hypothetical protein
LWTPQFSLSTTSLVSCFSMKLPVIDIFTGTAVYIFCVQPLGMPMSPTLPSMMNISFSLDDVGQQPFVHQGSSSGSGFAYHVNVFAKQGLADGLHVLKLNLAPNSMFILDYILVTQNVADTP